MWFVRVLGRLCSWSLGMADILFTSGCLLFSAYARLGYKGLLGGITWDRDHGTVHRLRTWLGELGWFELRPWCWRSGRVNIDLLNIACIEVGPLELDSVAVARSFCSEFGKHAFSILTGGYVSDARYEAGTVCSFCELGAISGREHEWWLCPAHLNDGLARPPQAAADLLCWPICSGHELSRVRIQHVVSVRKTRFRNRYD
eukprot:s1164_g9.t1